MTTANTNTAARTLTLTAVNGDEISRTLWGFRNTHLDTFMSYCTTQCWHMTDADGNAAGQALVVIVNGYHGTECRVALMLGDDMLDNCKMSFARGVAPALESFGFKVAP